MEAVLVDPSQHLGELNDLMEFTLDGKVMGPTPAPGKPYSERFIHGALYEARPEVMSVVHNHSVSVIPFSVVKGSKLRPLMPRKSRTRGSATVTKRSRNSYICTPRSVTMQPIA